MTAAGDRAIAMRAHLGKRVRVTLRGQDNYAGVADVALTGTVDAIAVRERGGSDWRGRQYDMVLTDAADRIVRTFALSRIKTIEPA